MDKLKQQALRDQHQQAQAVSAANAKSEPAQAVYSGPTVDGLPMKEYLALKAKKGANNAGSAAASSSSSATSTPSASAVGVGAKSPKT